jgi:hypothetical protein
MMLTRRHADNPIRPSGPRQRPRKHDDSGTLMEASPKPSPTRKLTATIADGPVADIACGLFDRLAPLHGLPADDRRLLTCACRVRAIARDPQALAGDGADVTAPLAGLGCRELAIVEAVNHYAAEVLPRTGHSIWRRLEAGERHRVAWLVALLRMAEGLAFELAGSAEGIYATWTDSLLHIEIDGGHVFGQQLTTARRKAAALESVSGRRLLLTSSYRRLGTLYPDRQIAN